jgi:aspartyl protease family protein
MFRLMAAGLVGAITATFAAQAMITYGRDHDAAALRSAQTVINLPPQDQAAQDQAAQVASHPAPEVSGGAAQVMKAADGHYWTEASVNGHEVRFLVDTGASAVSLTQSDARRLGIEPASLDYTTRVMTASGPARAARVKLDSIAVGEAQVRDVDALVIENGLNTSLLGMSYLGRLSQFEATQTSMIFRP